jgi:hypothetical protein
MSKEALQQSESPIGDMAWFQQESGFGHDKSCRLARLGLVPGAFQTQRGIRGSKRHFRKAKTLAWLAGLEA